MKNDIDYIECRFVTHVPTKSTDIPDVHLIKEVQHFKDGTTKPYIRVLKDFSRPYYITKPSKRNHKDKREYEHIDNVNTYYATESGLRSAIAKALNKPWSNEQYKDLASSPYLYGSDITSRSLVKQKYQAKYPCNMTPYGVATFDTETDVLNGTNQIIMATVIYKDKSYTAIQKSFLSGFSSPIDMIQACAKKYISETMEKHKLTLDFYIAEDEIDLLKHCFAEVHKWKPDFLAIWNMDFDITKVLDACERANVDPRTILCDPEIPPEFRICRYKQGPSKKVTASGQVKPINPANRWHTLYLSASYYVIDAMCAYRQIRLSDQELPSYSLDYVLKKEGFDGKLSFTEADGYSDLKWHQFMQQNYKLEYIVYNIFDSLVMLELDDKTKDLCVTLPSSAGTTPYDKFNSLPTKIADAFATMILQDKQHVLGTVGSNRKKEEKKFGNEEEDVAEYEGQDEEEEEDLQRLDLRNWINLSPTIE